MLVLFSVLWVAYCHIYFLHFVGLRDWIQDGYIPGQTKVLMELVLLPVSDQLDLGEFI